MLITCSLEVACLKGGGHLAETQNLNDKGKTEHRFLRKSPLGFSDCLSGRGRETMLYFAQWCLTEVSPGEQLKQLMVVRNYCY